MTRTTLNQNQTLLPAGAVIPFAGSSAPTGWLLCYGQAVSRTTYAILFAAIGTAHGSGDGSTTFNVPDMRGRVAAGVDNMGGTAANRLGSGSTGGITGGATLGAVGGEQAHTQTQNEMPSHNHNYTTLASNTGTGGGIAVGNNPPTNTGNTANTGGGAAMNVVQPTLVLNHIIKT